MPRPIQSGPKTNYSASVDKTQQGSPKGSSSSVSNSETIESKQQPLSQEAKSQKKAEQNLSSLSRKAALQKEDAEGKYVKKQTWAKVGHSQYEKKQHWEKTGTLKESETGVHGKTAQRGEEYKNEQVQATWFNKQPTAKGGVHRTEYYTTPEQQAKHQLSVKDGKVLGPDGKPLDTTGAQPGFNTGDGVAQDRMIYAMSQDGRIAAADYSAENKKFLNEYNQGLTNDRKRFHHTTFFGGEKVAAAGELEVKNGELKTISNISGHYKPSVETGVQTLQELKKQGVNVNNAKYDMFYITKEKQKVLSGDQVKEITVEEEQRKTRYATEVMTAHGNTKNIHAKLQTLDELGTMKQKTGASGSENLTPSKVKNQVKADETEKKNEEADLYKQAEARRMQAAMNSNTAPSSGSTYYIGTKQTAPANSSDGSVSNASPSSVSNPTYYTGNKQATPTNPSSSSSSTYYKNATEQIEKKPHEVHPGGYKNDTEGE